MQIDKDYDEKVSSSKNYDEPFLTKPVLEMSLDLNRFKREVSQATESMVKYVLVKSALEVDRCLKLKTPLQRSKLTACSQIFAEVRTIHLSILRSQNSFKCVGFPSSFSAFAWGVDPRGSIRPCSQSLFGGEAALG